MSDQKNHLREAAIFAEGVRRELRHLPADAVADVTDGIETDIAASLADGASLPTAGQYAVDLMRGAGLETKAAEPTSLHRFATVAMAFVGGWATRVRTFLRGLAPAWWIARAWVVMQVVGWVLSNHDSKHVFLGQWGEMPVIGILVFIGSVVRSVKSGRAAEQTDIVLRSILNAVLVVLAIFLLVTPLAYSQYQTYPTLGTERSYMVLPGDSPLSVANKFGVTLGALLAYNGWISHSQFPSYGEFVRIPPEDFGVMDNYTTTFPPETMPPVETTVLPEEPVTTTTAAG